MPSSGQPSSSVSRSAASVAAAPLARPRVRSVVLLLTLALAAPAGAVTAASASASAAVASTAVASVSPVASASVSAPRLRLTDHGDGVRSVDVPLRASAWARAGGDSYRSDVITASRFSMVGVSWRGGARDVRLKVRTDGGWSAWSDLAMVTDGPDRRSAERNGRVGTDLRWVAGADAVRIDVSGGRPPGLRLSLMEPSKDARRAGRAVVGASAKRYRNRPLPDLLSRSTWGADESLRSGSPTINRTIQQVHVHHTVNSNDYARSDVPGLLRGIYRYHTTSLGWSDIGYNFLVDRFGRIWVGRAGGAKNRVRGAHTLGFNSTSTGVAVIGNFETGRPSRTVITALVHLAAWKLHRNNRNPRGKVVVYSHGSDRFRAGQKVRLPAIDGHRDTNETACPGTNLYRYLPEIRDRAAQRANRFGSK